MYIKRNYSFWLTFTWSKTAFIIGFFYAISVMVLDYVYNINLSLPWHPIGVVGVALALYLGFKNTSSYTRITDSEKAYSNIADDIHSFATAMISFVRGKNADKIKKELTYRHIAWLTAFRFQLRSAQPWENSLSNGARKIDMPNIQETGTDKLYQELKLLLPPKELELYKTKTNLAIQIMHKQSQRIQDLKDEGYINNFQHMELQKLITNTYHHQGDAEIIKNCPFPRQYSSTSRNLTIIFCLIAPLGIYEAFENSIKLSIFDLKMIWAYPVITGFITWIFFLIEKVSAYSENPFENTINALPITYLSRDVEINLREMLGETNVPQPIKDTDGILM